MQLKHSLSYHPIIISGDPNECPHCNKTLLNINRKDTHIKVCWANPLHTDRVECELCNQEFTSNFNLKLHTLRSVSYTHLTLPTICSV